ncbi:MAG TPA: hypothetical protein VIT91_02470 [Chthoniobacterales bacterium]
MLHFRDHHWLLVPGTSRFTAWIDPSDAKPEDLRWVFALHYEAGGPQWRRVPSWHRPTLIIENHNFRPRIRHWAELEQVAFWELVPYDQDYDGGTLLAKYTSRETGATTQTSLIEDQVWRIAGRDRRWFTLEFAGFMDRGGLLEKLDETLVTAGSQPASTDIETDFWKANAQLYLIEAIPFGMVTVRVPRNVRDPERYALGRARSLLGLERPEHLEIQDYARHPNSSELIQGDLNVHLHFHGYYED